MWQLPPIASWRPATVRWNSSGWFCLHYEYERFSEESRVKIFPRANLGYYLSFYVNAQIRNANWINGTTNLFFNFQGLVKVLSIDRNNFPPSTMVDHFTSFGEALINSSQMSAVECIVGDTTGWRCLFSKILWSYSIMFIGRETL